MARIKAFRGLRPEKKLAEQVAELPYDVCDSDEARQITEGNPYSFYHITKSEIDLPREVDLYDKQVYEKAAENLKKFISEKTLIQDEEEFLYLYTLVMGGREQTGLVATVSVDDYLNNVVKKHEHTREDKENDRIRHIDALGAQTGPVFLFFKTNSEKEKLWDEMLSLPVENDFVSVDGVRHIIRVINNKDLIKRVIELLGPDIFYIADGHHRAASAVKNAVARRNAGKDTNADFNWFLSVIFPDRQLHIMPYNRLVKDLNGMSSAEFIEALSKHFEILESSVDAPVSTRQFAMYLDSKWYSLVYRGEISSDPVKSLDVSILQDVVLQPLLGIDNPRTSKRIDFVGGIRGTAELKQRVDSGSWAVAFSMYPTSIRDLILVSDNDQVMPPKSTWFEPKLRSGLVIHKFEDK